MTDNQRRVIDRLAAAGVVATLVWQNTGRCTCGSWDCDHDPAATLMVAVNGSVIDWAAFQRLAVVNPATFAANCHPFAGDMFVDMPNGGQIRISNNPNWVANAAASSADMFHV